MAEPIVKLETNGQASVISYNVPEPTSYSGSHIVELEFDSAVFTARAKEIPESRKNHLTEDEISRVLDEVVITGVADSKVFPNIGMNAVNRNSRNVTRTRR